MPMSRCVWVCTESKRKEGETSLWPLPRTTNIGLFSCSLSLSVCVDVVSIPPSSSSSFSVLRLSQLLAISSPLFLFPSPSLTAMTDTAKLEKALDKLVQEGAETGKILGACERLLAAKPSHLQALQCKVVCCIHQEKFGAAISVLDMLEAANNSSGKAARLSASARANAKFQRAYCLYRMRRYTEAKVVLTSTSGGDLTSHHLPSQHLLAQVHYNLEEFPAAAALYKALLDARAYHDETERVEMETNYTAVLASGGEPKQAVAVVQSADERTSDLVYNAATALVEAGDYAAAERMLQQAEALYAQDHPKSRIKSLKDALALPDEAARAEMLGTQGTAERLFFNDVANTWVQMAFVKYATHDEAAAESTLALVTEAKPSSAVTTAMALINWTAVRRHKDFVDASKKLKAAQNERVASRLTSRQRLVVRYNTALLHLNSGNLNSCKRVVEAMAKDDPEHELTQSLRLVIAARETKGKRQGAAGGAAAAPSSTEALINDFVATQSSSPSASKLIQLIAVQVYVEIGDLAQALEAFKNPALAELASSPAGVATRAAWLTQLGHLAEAASVVEAAVTGGRLRLGSQKALLSWAVHFFATQEEKDGNAESVAMLKRVRAAVPALASDREVTAMLSLCLATCGSSHLAEARRCLSGIADGGTGGSDTSAPSRFAKKEIEALEKKQPSRSAVEELGYHRHTLSPSGGAGAGGADEGSGKQARTAKRRRARPMRHPPKNAPEKGKAPDPERWITMSMRSYIKDLPPRKKKELKRLRAQEQEQKRKAAERRKAEAAAAAAAATPSLAEAASS